jgi:hypothetical protein
MNEQTLSDQDRHPPRERLIFARRADLEQARRLVDTLGDSGPVLRWD